MHHKLKYSVIFILMVSGLLASAKQEKTIIKNTQLTVRSFIDGSDIVKIQGNKIWFEHRNFALPGTWKGHNDHSGDEPTFINEEKWIPKWNKKISKPFIAKKIILAKDESKKYHVSVIKGRGKVKILSQPTAKNKFTLSILIDDDKFSGAQWYTIGLK
jgi:hypothetical protein